MLKSLKWVYFNCSKCGKSKYLINTEENQVKASNAICNKCLKKEIKKEIKVDEPVLVKDENEEELFLAK